MVPDEILYILSWWFLFLLFGLVSIPLCGLIFRRFIDLGYGFAKTAGLLIITFATFLLGSFRVAPLTNTTVYLISLAYVFLNAFIFWRDKQKISSAVTKNLRILLAQEILFSSGFIFWSLVRGYQPDINGLEKFMDFGFINSIIRSRYLPPADMWFAGNSINYYWFGHLWTAVATKLSSIPSNITYNLMLATILGLSLTSAFSIVASLVKNLKPKLDRRVFYAAGIISALLLTFAGNFHTPIYVLKEGPENYWYPDATRFIGYNPETNDKTIHEFPIYSFVVSDLHPHLMNFPFVLLYIGLLLKVLTGKKGESFSLRRLAPLGFVLGIMFMTNTWDFANYSLVTGVGFILFSLVNRKFDFKLLLTTGKALLTILTIALLVALPFIVNFKSLAQGVGIVDVRSPLWQLGVLWGFPAILTTIFAVLLFKFRPEFERSDLFITSLLFASWILIAIPEIIFVKDIYVGSHQRANTMFKLTYQAFVMFYLSAGYITVRTLTLIRKTSLKRTLSIFFAVLFTSVLSYSSFAVNSFYGELKNYKGLAGDTWLKEQHPDEYAAMRFLMDSVSGQPTILEAPGDSYTEFNVISSYTGLPTVSGWFVHEWLWRGSADFPQARVADIVQIYTSEDIEVTKRLLAKYEVEYVIVGNFERQKYPNLNEEKFSQLGTQVFSSGNTKIYRLY